MPTHGSPRVRQRTTLLTRSLVSSQQPSAATLDISTASASLHSETLPSTRNASPAAARDSPASSSGGSSSNYRPLSLESLRGGEGSDGELPFQDPQDRRDEQQHFALATQQRNSYYISYRAQLASSDQQHATPQRPRLRVLPRQQSQPQAALLQHLEEEPAHLLHRQLSQPPILNPARHTQVPNSGLSGMPGTGAFGDMGSQPLLLNSLSSPAQHATTSLAPSSSPMRPSAHPPGAAPLTSQPTSANTQYGGPSPARQEPQQQQQHHHHQQQSQHGYPHGHLQLLHLTAAAGGGPVGPSALWPAASQHTREGGAGVSAPSGPFAGSWAGPAGPVATAAVAGCFGRQGVPEWEDEGLCCRVCMEPVGQDDLTSGLALRLGCRCSSGLDVIHAVCAERWFRGVRGETVCEVCGAEAHNLPASVKADIRWQQMLCPGRPPAGGDTASGPGGLLLGGRLGALPSFLGLYTLVCLLPATLCATSLVLFYYRFVGADAGVTMALSILVSSATILHWVFAPYRPILHATFCLASLGGVIIQTLLFKVLCGGWGPTTVAISGAVVGFAAGCAIFYGVLLPSATLVRYVVAHCTARRRALAAHVSALRGAVPHPQPTAQMAAVVPRRSAPMPLIGEHAGFWTPTV